MQGTDVGFDPRLGVPQAGARVGNGWGWGEGHLRGQRCEFLRGAHCPWFWRIERLGYHGDSEPAGRVDSPRQLDTSGC